MLQRPRQAGSPTVSPPAKSPGSISSPEDQRIAGPVGQQ
jgi:hypothetical protein